METFSDTRQVVVIGAGPAGLASALALKDAGLRPLVIDQADQVGSAWRGRYDRLRLNTSRFTSHLPDRPFPKGTPLFPTRDQVVEHFESHAREPGIDFQLGTRVETLEPGDSWLIGTSAGEVRAPQVIVATGYENEPILPEWSQGHTFAGRLLHAREYRNPEPFGDAAVLVVGPGCTGMEIAFDLAEGGAKKVWLSARTPPNVLTRQGPGGLPGEFVGIAFLHAPTRVGDAVARFGRRMDLGDLTEYGLPVPEEGVFSRLRRLGVAPTIVDEEMIEAIKTGRIEVVRGVESLDSEGAHLADGARVEPDAIICATGYRRGLEPLVGHLGVLDESGMPRAHGDKPAAKGLRFIGYVPRPGAIGYIGREAKRAARAIARELRITEARALPSSRQPIAAGG
jgi:cation diffusion facilitator CzcD-associated flavoprotein CzcO